MAENLTLARPYARAGFELARDKTAYDRCAEVLSELAAKSGGKLDQQARNFVSLLADNRRLGLLPEIAADYERLRAEAENTLEGELVGAMPGPGGGRERRLG